MSKTPKDVVKAIKKRKAAPKKRSTKAFDWYEAASKTVGIAAKRPATSKDKR